jgi:uncharacterized protein YecE (DUF72 family)
LQRYARQFSSVEGNTTFYGLPKPDTVQRWHDETPDDFRFCFKFHQDLSHRSALEVAHPKVAEQFQVLEPLASKIGLLNLQLPKSFNSEGIEHLHRFFSALPDTFNYSVEVRHPEFFDKGDEEREFNQMLLETGVNRVMFDTRPIFAVTASDSATLDAQQKKPKVPLHVIATGQNPQVRFISTMQWQQSERYLDQWVSKALQWIEEGRVPYLFFHTPDCAEAPELAARFVHKLKLAKPTLQGATPELLSSEQGALF